jgi:hypothetical protein
VGDREGDGASIPLSTIIEEVLLEVRSEELIPVLRYGGEKSFLLVHGVINPDTIVATYWPDIQSSLTQYRSVRLVLPLTTSHTHGRYLPSCVAVRDQRAYVAVGTEVHVFRLGTQTTFERQYALPVVPTALHVDRDTLFFVADQWNSDHSSMPGARRGGYYGSIAINGMDEDVAWWHVDEPRGLVLNLFQPRTFLATNGTITAWVRGLGDSLIIEQRGRRLSQTSLQEVCSGDLARALQSFTVDTTWQRRPQIAMDVIRPLYKNVDAIRQIEIIDDSCIVITIDHGTVHTEGILKGRNVTRRYTFGLEASGLRVRSVVTSTSPLLHESPANNVPLSRHMCTVDQTIIAIESINVRMVGQQSYEQLLAANEENAAVDVHRVSIQKRSGSACTGR